MTQDVVRTEHGVVAAGHQETVRAAAEILRAGGNAYDAAVAAGFAAAVAEPALTSLGGGGFLLAATATGEQVLVDFFVDTPGRGLPPGELDPHFTPVTVRFPGAEQVFHVGWGSAAVPGCLPGYLHVHERFGRLDLAQVTAPAQRLARAGVPMNPTQAHILHLLRGVVTLTPDAAGVFAPGGVVLEAGDALRNPTYADLLESLAEGSITGLPDIAGPLVAAMAANHGLLTADDLAGYRVIEREPLRMRYRGHEILTNPPPSFGGSLVLEALRTLAEDGPAQDDPAGNARLAEVLVAMGRSHAAGRPEAQQGHSQVPDRAFLPPDPLLRSSRGTTQVSIADAEGNVASMTTSNGSCSGVFAPGTGIHLNNIMGEDDLHPDGFHAAPPGMRVGSMMAPSVVRCGDGRTVALGSGGSERIRSALAQVLVNLLDRGMPLAEAVEHPRMHWDGSLLQAEAGLGEAALAAITEAHPVNLWGARNLYFGGAHVVATATRDHVPPSAVGDPRRGGSAWRG